MDGARTPSIPYFRRCEGVTSVAVTAARWKNGCSPSFTTVNISMKAYCVRRLQMLGC